VTCPRCGASAAPGSPTCSRCGTTLTARTGVTHRTRNTLLVLMALLVLLVFVGVSLVAGVINRNAGSPDGPSPNFAAPPPATASVAKETPPSLLLHAHQQAGHDIVQTTAPFTTTKPWAERYSYTCGSGSGVPLAIQVVPADRATVGHFIDIFQTQPGTGASGVHRVKATGRFRLVVRVASDCDWTVSVPAH
jgi:predicted nucleic acid-binding Zn ribbon protein